MLDHRSSVRRIASKELSIFFSSAMAYLFLASFVAVTLFVVFWGEAFFARNIADVRPVFEWMPILLIFLASTLTMRLWSEERRNGTLEHILTQPVPLWNFVLGKFLGCLTLLGMAIALTLPIPLSVSLIAHLDWGPVWAGYLATFLLGAAYLAVGLFVSSRCDNQLVSLLSSVSLCGVFYLVGSPLITELFSTDVAEWLQALGTGSRFEDITRGVVDLRDLLYYLGMMVVFLTLNTFALEAERWSRVGSRPRHQQWRVVCGLIVANAVGANLWLGQLEGLRIDVTEGDRYSITEPTRETLQRLNEPLLLRAYLSPKTHPLLAPLVPELKDLLKEYALVGGSRVRVEFVDPTEEPELEEQANAEFSIKPVAFKVADRYEASIRSSYFHVLVKYGDQWKVLEFQDLIEVKQQGAAEVDVRLRNPEYDLTRAIKSVVAEYQASGNLFSTLTGSLTLKAYISADETLPPTLREARENLSQVLEQLAEQSQGNFTWEIVDPLAGDGAVAEEIARDFGFVPMAVDYQDPQRFYFYLALEGPEQTVPLSLADLDRDALEESIKSGLKRFSPGFTKTVALATPRGSSFGAFQALREFLGEELTVESEDLGDGQVSSRADVLVVMAPRDLDEKSLFAVDQFLMRGGTVVLGTSPFSAGLSRNSMTLSEVESGLADWLEHYGIGQEKTVVQDLRCSALPVPVTRSFAGRQFQEIRLLEYPYFLDLRPGVQGLNQEHPVTRDLPQLTMAFASPLTVDGEKNKERKVSELLNSSADSWTSASREILPQLDQSGRPILLPGSETKSHLVGAAIEGRFDSYFQGKDSPLVEDGSQATASTLLERSPDTARLVVFSSNDFLRDRVLSMTGSGLGSRYLQGLQLMANTIDWALQDTSLMSIRSRGHYNRTLPPLSKKAQLAVEYGNYLMAGLALLLLAIVNAVHRRRRQLAFRKLWES